MKQKVKEHRKKTFKNLVCIDLCVTVIIVLVGIIGLIVAPDRIIGTYKYLQNINESLVYPIPPMVAFFGLSIVADGVYLASKDPSLLIEGYARNSIWIKIVSVVFCLICAAVVLFLI